MAGGESSNHSAVDFDASVTTARPGGGVDEARFPMFDAAWWGAGAGAVQADPRLKAPSFQPLIVKRIYNIAFNLNLLVSELAPLQRGAARCAPSWSPETPCTSPRWGGAG